MMEGWSGTFKVNERRKESRVCELDTPDEGDCRGFGDLADCERPVTFPLKFLGQQI